MTTFRYKARDSAGKAVEGVMEAESADAVAQRLQQQGKAPVLVEPTKAVVKFNIKLGLFRKVSFNDLNMFTRQLFTLQKAGLPLLSSLMALQKQATTDTFKKVIQKIVNDVEAGDSFSSALIRHPSVFNQIYTSMIKTGEATGRLDETLERVAILGEHDEDIRRRVKAALRYPIIVVSTLVLGFIVVITFVVPKFSSLYGKFGTDLPLPTQILLGIHYVVVNYWWTIIMAIGISIYFFHKSISTVEGGTVWDRFKLRIPIFGPLMLQLAMSRFSRITGTLLKSGVPILQTFEIVANGIGNRSVAKTINSIQSSVSQGKSISEPVEKSDLFPPIVVQMISVGEKSGRLHELLMHVSDYYDGQIDYKIKNLVTLIEPLLIFTLGLGVLLMALGIFMPMWSLMRLFR